MYISYVDDRPVLKFHSLEKLIYTIENNYRDELEDKNIEIKDEEGNLIVTLPPRKSQSHDPNLYAREIKSGNTGLTCYLDQFGFITEVL